MTIEKAREIIEVLQLKKNARGFYSTTRGNKNEEGILAILEDIIYSHEK